MKKVFFGLALVAGMASCKKDYTCECTTSMVGMEDVVTTATINGKKKDVKAACEAGTSSLMGMGITCEIK